MKMSVCIDILFFRQDFLPALQVVKEAGFSYYEMWSLGDHPHGIGARNKNLQAIAAEAERLGLSCAACVGPFGDLTSRAVHSEFLSGLKSDIAKAKILGCPTIIVNLGGAGEPTDPSGSIGNSIRVLREAARIAEQEGVVIALEPLNSLVDHKNSILTHAAEGFSIVDAVDSPSLKLLYDIYHQQVMDGRLTDTILANLDRIAHLHIAGVPGRHEPTAGEVNYQWLLNRIADAGYKGCAGLEYKPEKPVAESLREVRSLLVDR